MPRRGRSASPPPASRRWALNPIRFGENKLATWKRLKRKYCITASLENSHKSLLIAVITTDLPMQYQILPLSRQAKSWKSLVVSFPTFPIFFLVTSQSNDLVVSKFTKHLLAIGQSYHVIFVRGNTCSSLWNCHRESWATNDDSETHGFHGNVFRFRQMASAPQRAAPAPAPAQRAPAPVAAPPSAVAPAAAPAGGGKQIFISNQAKILSRVSFRHDGKHRIYRCRCRHWICCRPRNHRNVQRIWIIWRTGSAAAAGPSRSATVASRLQIARTNAIWSVRMGNQAIPAVRSAAERPHPVRWIQRGYSTVQVGQPLLSWMTTKRFFLSDFPLFITPSLSIQLPMTFLFISLFFL